MHRSDVQLFRCFGFEVKIWFCFGFEVEISFFYLFLWRKSLYVASRPSVLVLFFMHRSDVQLFWCFGFEVKIWFCFGFEVEMLFLKTVFLLKRLLFCFEAQCFCLWFLAGNACFVLCFFCSEVGLRNMCCSFVEPHTDLAWQLSSLSSLHQTMRGSGWGYSLQLLLHSSGRPETWQALQPCRRSFRLGNTRI